MVDRGDQDLAILFRLRHHLTAGTTPALLHGIQRIVVHDVYHLSLVHYALVSLLIKLVDDGGMLQHFSSGLNIDAVTFAEFTWQRFVADESLAALVLPEFAWPRRGGNLEALSERLFSRGWGSHGPDDTFTVIAAPVALVKSNHGPSHPRALGTWCLPRADRHRGAESRPVRRSAGVGLPPLSDCALVPSGLPLFHVPLTKTVFSLLELADSTYPRMALLKLLTSSYLRPDGPWPNDVVGLVCAVGYLDRCHAPLPAQLEAYVRRQQPTEEDTRRIVALADWVEALQTALDDLVGESRPSWRISSASSHF